MAWWKGENLQSMHDGDGVFNHFTYSWGGYSPPLTWPPHRTAESPIGGLHASGRRPRRGEKEGFIPQGTAFELIPVGLVHRNLEPEQWVLRIRNLPSPNSQRPGWRPSASAQVSAHVESQNLSMGAGGLDGGRGGRVPIDLQYLI